VLVLLVRAESVQALCPEDANDGAKDIRLLNVNVDQVRRFFLDVINRFFDVKRL
jgi:hypothetical protein